MQNWVKVVFGKKVKIYILEHFSPDIASVIENRCDSTSGMHNILHNRVEVAFEYLFMPPTSQAFATYLLTSNCNLWNLRKFHVKSQLGQLISKCLFGVFNFFQKMNKWIHFYYYATCFRSFFVRNWRHQKDISNYLSKLGQKLPKFNFQSQFSQPAIF